jgi:hypothetical protein
VPLHVFPYERRTPYDPIMEKSYDIRIGRHRICERGFHRLDDAKRKADEHRAGRRADPTPIYVVVQGTGEVVYEANARQ